MIVECPNCSNDDPSMLELETTTVTKEYWYCEVCSKEFIIEKAEQKKEERK